MDCVLDVVICKTKVCKVLAFSWCFCNLRNQAEGTQTDLCKEELEGKENFRQFASSECKLNDFHIPEVAFLLVVIVS